MCEAINKKPHECGGYSSSSLKEFSFFICVVTKPAPIATHTPMPNAILFRDTPIATPIANPVPIILYGTLLISKSTHHPTNKKPHECGALLLSIKLFNRDNSNKIISIAHRK